jgi:hypothetical protein
MALTIVWDMIVRLASLLAVIVAAWLSFAGPSLACMQDDASRAPVLAAMISDADAGYVDDEEVHEVETADEADYVDHKDIHVVAVIARVRDQASAEPDPAASRRVAAQPAPEERPPNSGIV